MIEKTVLFDLDGVLVDLVKVHFDSLNLALEMHGYTPIEIINHNTIYDGLPTKVKLQMLDIPEKDRSKIINAKQHFTIRDMKELIRPDRDKIAVMHCLRMAGYDIGCVTNSVKETADLALKLSFLGLFMDVVVTNEDVDKHKPYPDPYRFAMDVLEVNSGFAVEDNDKGVQSATDAGLTVIRVTNPSEINDNLLRRIYNEYSNSNGGRGI